jgi:hypothetical protein
MIANQNYMMGPLHKPIIPKWWEVMGMYQINCLEKFGKPYMFTLPIREKESGSLLFLFRKKEWVNSNVTLVKRYTLAFSWAHDWGMFHIILLFFLLCFGCLLGCRCTLWKDNLDAPLLGRNITIPRVSFFKFIKKFGATKILNKRLVEFTLEMLIY